MFLWVLMSESSTHSWPVASVLWSGKGKQNWRCSDGTAAQVTSLNPFFAPAVAYCSELGFHLFLLHLAGPCRHSQIFKGILFPFLSSCFSFSPPSHPTSLCEYQNKESRWRSHGYLFNFKNKKLKNKKQAQTQIGLHYFPSFSFLFLSPRPLSFLSFSSSIAFPSLFLLLLLLFLL